MDGKEGYSDGLVGYEVLTSELERCQVVDMRLSNSSKIERIEQRHYGYLESIGNLPFRSISSSRRGISCKTKIMVLKECPH